jgi:hypothetical protein
MIPYIEEFYSLDEADQLFDFIRTQPHVRPRNKRNNKSFLRRLSFPGYSPPLTGHHTASRYGMAGSLEDAPQPYKDLAARLTAYAGKEMNYLSTIGYLTDDHMNFHQHREDKVREDQSVYVLSLGAVHPVAIRPLGCTDRSRYEIFYPAHGSLYVLPSEYNRTHEHAVLEGTDRSHAGMRIGINCKHISAGLSPDEMRKACSRPAGDPADFHMPKAQPPGVITRWNAGTNHWVRVPGQQPQIWDKHKGKIFPSGAVNVDRTTIFGNQNKHHLDTAAGRYKWAVEAAEKMKDEAFAAEVEKLRGCDLLCWCTPKQVAKGWCHALTWLRLANKGDS